MIECEAFQNKIIIFLNSMADNTNCSDPTTTTIKLFRYLMVTQILTMFCADLLTFVHARAYTKSNTTIVPNARANYSSYSSPIILFCREGNFISSVTKNNL